MKYRKKPVEIDAVQFLGFDKYNGKVLFDDRPDWLTNEFGKRISFFEEVDELDIKTLEGKHVASKGDYVIKGIKGEFYPCKPDIFKLTYDKVE